MSSPTLNHVPFAEPLAEGVELFNCNAFWHAHEAWEQGWRLAAQPAATCYKGLIQTAAALVHWQRGNPRGLVRNWAKARPRLVAVLVFPCPLDLPRLLADMDAFVVAHGIPKSLHTAQQTTSCIHLAPGSLQPPLVCWLRVG